jgi:hypothetical protein
MQVRKSRRPRRPLGNLVQPLALLIASLALVDKVITLVDRFQLFHR